MFQSTPTGFPAGDQRNRLTGAWREGFNPRRPVSRPATVPLHVDPFNQYVSIHADRFPGRRPGGCANSWWMTRFQSTPTGFPAGDDRLGRRSAPAHVSIHADRFPGRRRSPIRCSSARGWFQSTPTGFPAGDHHVAPVQAWPSGFNPRRPVSRPATMLIVSSAASTYVSIHADRFPGRRP